MSIPSVTFRLVAVPLLLATALLVSPASAVTVNVDATAENGFGGAGEQFLNLAPGTYMVSPLGISSGGDYDAWSAWDGTNDVLVATAAGTGVEGWLNSYIVASPDLTVLNPDPSWLVIPGVGYQVSDGMVYPSAADALAASMVSYFTLPDGMVSYAVSFLFLDGSPENNRGGNSLSVTQVPLPASLLLLVTALAGLFGVSRQRKAVAA